MRSLGAIRPVPDLGMDPMRKAWSFEECGWRWCWTEIRGRRRDGWDPDRRADGSLMMQIAAAVLWRRERTVAAR